MAISTANIMIIAGEVSGDMHGAALIHELNKFNHDIRIFGIGGNLMKREGANLLYHLDRMAFLGFVEVVKHIPFMKQVQSELINTVLNQNIRTVVLIDYPGFNLNVAKKLKSLNVKLIYYISPQVWAWGRNRVDKIKRLVDKMIVVFPFEKEIYQNAGVNVEYVGHPLMEIISKHKFLSKSELYDKFQLDSSKEILLVLPGSRNQEVEKIFPESINAAEVLARDYNLQIVVCASQNISEEFIFKTAQKSNFKVITEHTYDLMKYSKFGIIKSGTSTLEAAIFQLPMIIVYKTSGLTYFIGKKLIKLKNIGMANIILNEEVVPELIQNDVSSQNIITKSKEILSNSGLYDNIRLKLGLVKEKLGENGASKKAAQIIYNLMNDFQKN